MTKRTKRKEKIMEETKRRNWGKPFSIIGLIFGIISLVFGLFSLIPLLGLAFAIITGILAVIAITMAIPGIIGSIGKGRAITALVFGSTMLTWAIIRYSWIIYALAQTA
jgi:hypothetical protein